MDLFSMLQDVEMTSDALVFFGYGVIAFALVKNFI